MKNIVCVIFGKKGSGKTELAKKIFNSLDRVIVLDSLVEYTEGVIISDIEDFLDYIKRNYEGSFKIILRLDSDKEVDLAFESFWTLYNVTILIEEADLYCQPGYENPHFSRLIRYGRHRQINLIGLSRRPAEISRNLTGQADIVCSFRQEEPRDIAYMRARVGRNALKLQSLGEYKFICFGEPSLIENFFPKQVLDAQMVSLSEVKETEKIEEKA